MEKIRNFETRFTGWSFIVAALMLWLGWMLLPHQIGEYIVKEDFALVGENVWYWIWMYRIHIFGWVIMGIALMALVASTARTPSRIMVVPGAGMIIVGTFTLALAAAYFYNHGAWGVGKTAGMSPAELDEFMDKLLYTNQYVTCFIRFGRVFSGVGFVLLGAAFIKWSLFDKWLGWFTVLFGLLAMGVVMLIPDYYESYKPLFHVKALWLTVVGVVLLIKGLPLARTSSE